MDKCFESLPRGPAGSSDFAEVEFSVDSNGGTSSDHQQAAKIRNLLKLVEMASICSAGVKEHGGDGKTANRTVGDHVCAVCLGEIRGEEMVYELPRCDHIFHSACLDRWVCHNHNTCPLCRTCLIAGSSCGLGTTVPDDIEGLEEDPGFSLGIRFISRYATNVNIAGSGWRHSVMRLVGF